MMQIKTFRNKRNPHKMIDVKHTADGHYMWRQRIVYDNGIVNIVNHVGTLKGGYRRMNKATIDEVMADRIRPFDWGSSARLHGRITPPYMKHLQEPNGTIEPIQM